MTWLCENFTSACQMWHSYVIFDITTHIAMSHFDTCSRIFHMTMSTSTYSMTKMPWLWQNLTSACEMSHSSFTFDFINGLSCYLIFSHAKLDISHDYVNIKLSLWFLTSSVKKLTNRWSRCCGYVKLHMARWYIELSLRQNELIC